MEDKCLFGHPLVGKLYIEKFDTDLHTIIFEFNYHSKRWEKDYTRANLSTSSSFKKMHKKEQEFICNENSYIKNNKFKTLTMHKHCSCYDLRIQYIEKRKQEHIETFILLSYGSVIECINDYIDRQTYVMKNKIRIINNLNSIYPITKQNYNNSIQYIEKLLPII